MRRITNDGRICPCHNTDERRPVTQQFERATPDELSRTIITYADIPLVELAPGAMSHIVAGERMTLSIANLKADSYFPVHTHNDMEQMMLILSGELDAILDGKLFRMKAGDIIRFPAGHEHGARMIDVDCEIVDIFGPRRPDYEEKLRKVTGAGA
jgi:quercetin dioxygenase-like cupin family protein